MGRLQQKSAKRKQGSKFHVFKKNRVSSTGLGCRVQRKSGSQQEQGAVTRVFYGNFKQSLRYTYDLYSDLVVGLA